MPYARPASRRRVRRRRSRSGRAGVSGPRRRGRARRWAMADVEVLEGDEAYHDAEPVPRPLDHRMLREPIKTLEMRPTVSLARGTSLAEAIRQMQQHRVGCVMVVDGGRLAGILTERDILYKVLGTGQDLGQGPGGAGL